MNFAQKLGLLILILIFVLYIYSSLSENGLKFPDFNHGQNNNTEYNPLDNQITQENVAKENNIGNKTVKIFILDKSGNLRSVNRTCDASKENSCLEYAIRELLSAPSQWEKSKGFASEIPQGTKLISIRESAGAVQIDLSSEFETGGGAESTYLRIKQLIKTVNANSSVPAYLYIKGKQANVIGGEGVMLKQPLNDKSLEE